MPRSSLLDWLPEPARRLPGNTWPQVLGPRQAALAALLEAVDRTQWLSPEALLSHQLEQAQAVIRFAHARSPFYRDRLDRAGYDPSSPLDMEALRRIPILHRDTLQAGGIDAERIPRAHMPVVQKRTSGSTGTPVKIRATAFQGRFYQALCARDNAWQGRDPAWKLASIRFDAPDEGKESRGWAVGGYWDDLSGPSAVLSIAKPVSAQARWLQELRPDMLLSYPSNLRALALYMRDREMPLELKQIITIGESLTANVRRTLSEVWDAPVRDLYSCEELGYLASPCPEAEGYHVHAENVLMEVLDPDDRPCEPGQVGRVVLTGLQHLATPLIRYEIRDHAEVGPPCSCGRGLPVLTRIVGRRRNMLTLPDGDQRWPLTGYQTLVDELPITQFQYVQTDLERIEARLVATRPLDERERARAVEVIQTALGYPFQVELVFRDRLESNPNGKFEEFMSRL